MRDYGLRCGATDPNAVPAEISYLWSEVIQNYDKLNDRYDRVVTKKKRFRELSQPKHINKIKHHQLEKKCTTTKRKTKLEIVDTTDRMESTRIEQLSYPPVRLLKKLKEHPSYTNSFDDPRKSSVNRLLRKGLYSVYSRLQNVTPDEEPPGVNKKVTQEEHKANLKSKRAETMKRIQELSKPKNFVTEEQPQEWFLKDALKHFRPTQRLNKISQPKPAEKPELEENFFRVHPKALTYIPSKGIKALAAPAKYRLENTDEIADKFQTQETALKYVASRRIKQLAEPKYTFDMNVRADAYSVAKSALKAKLTPRLKELSQPRQRC